MSLLNNKILVFDTEYDTNPKRLLALAYKVYSNGKKTTEDISYIKHNNFKFQKDRFAKMKISLKELDKLYKYAKKN